MKFHELIQDRGVQAAGAVLIGLFVFFNVVEFAWSQLRKNNFFTFSSLLINVTLAFLQQLTDVFNKLIFILGYVYVLENFSVQQLMGMHKIPLGFPVTFDSNFPFIQVHLIHLLTWISILIIADFCQYWLHRLSHEVNILWAGHIVHHSMEAYNFAVALRQSFIESLYTWIFYLPLAFLGVPWQLFIMAYTISLAWQFLVHTRYINKLSWLETIFSTPSHHRVHHGKNEIYIDKNYGAFLIIWDKLFGTFEPETEEVQYGIKFNIDTHNPVWVNTHHHLRIWKLFTGTKSFTNKIKILFGRPAFIPGDCHVEDIPVYQTQEITSLKKIYVLFNFLLIVIFSVMQLIRFESGGNIFFFSISAIIIFSSHSINISLLEGRRWADKAEIARLLLLVMAGIILNVAVEWRQGLSVAVTAIILLGFTYWIAIDYQDKSVSREAR